MQENFKKLFKELSPSMAILIDKYVIEFDLKKTNLYFIDLKNEDLKFIINILFNNLNGVRELRDFYEWVGMSSLWALEPPFISYSTWKDFMYLYETQGKHKQLAYKILKDVNYNFGRFIKQKLINE